MTKYNCAHQTINVNGVNIPSRKGRALNSYVARVNLVVSVYSNHDKFDFFAKFASDLVPLSFEFCLSVLNILMNVVLKQADIV